MTELEEIAKAIWTEAHGDNDPREPTWDTWPKDGRAASLAYADYSKDDFFRFARAAVKAISEPSEAMLSAAAGALKVHIDALPAEVRAKSKERGGVVFVGPVEKHAIRFRAMIDTVLNEARPREETTARQGRSQ